MATKKSGAGTGRPTVMTAAVIGKLEEAFALGCSDKESCLLAGINPDSLYQYQRKNLAFTERKELLKQRPILLARSKVISELDEDSKVAMWYLERKRGDEFSPRQQISIDHTARVDDSQLLDAIQRTIAEIRRQTAHLGLTDDQPRLPSPEE